MAACRRGRAPANALLSLPLALPLLPRSTAEVTANLNEAVAETIGWPELVDQVAAVVGQLPEEEQTSVVLLAASYGEAGALDRFGRARGLPSVHSPHNGYADFRRPTDDRATVVAVRYPTDRLAPHFERCDQVAVVDKRLRHRQRGPGHPDRGVWRATNHLDRHLGRAAVPVLTHHR